MIRRTKVTLLTGAAALVTAVAGTGVAFVPGAAPAARTPAAFSSTAPPSTAPPSTAPPSTAPPSTAPQSQDVALWPGHGGCGMSGGMRGWGLLRQIEHGEATLRTAHGSEVLDLQRGTVESVSSGELTVRSADGFSATYVVNNSTHIRKNWRPGSNIMQVMTNDRVVVLATKSGSTATAIRVVDTGHATTNH